MTRSLHRHSFVVQGHLHTVHPAYPQSPSYPPPLTSANITLLAIRYSSILSTCPNHLNTLWTALLANSLSILAVLRTSSFLTLSIRDTPTKFLKHFISRTFTFLLSALLIPHASAPYNAAGTITPSYRHFMAFIPSPLLLSTLFSAPHALYTHDSFCVPHPCHTLHQLPLATPCT